MQMQCERSLLLFCISCEYAGNSMVGFYSYTTRSILQYCNVLLPFKVLIKTFELVYYVN